MRARFRRLMLSLLLVASSSTAGAAQTAAPFVLKAPDGTSHHYPADAAGKPVVLMFWPAWCPYSRALQPYLQEVQTDYAAAGVKVWMLDVNRQDGHDPVQVLRDRGLQLPLLLEADAVMPDYRVEHTPWLVVVDGQQNIVYTRPPKPPTPIDTAREVRLALNALVGDLAVAVPTAWPRPYEGHLSPEQQAAETLFAGQPPRRDNLRRAAPPPLPQSEWAPWVERYLAGVQALETFPGVAPRGAVANGRAAISIARDVWTEVYGEPAVQAQAPYRAYRMNTQWIVLGAPPGLGLGEGMILVIQQDTGRVQRSVRGTDAPSKP